MALLGMGFAASGLSLSLHAEAMAATVLSVLFRDPSTLSVLGAAAMLIGALGAFVALHQLIRHEAVIVVVK